MRSTMYVLKSNFIIHRSIASFSSHSEFFSHRNILVSRNRVQFRTVSCNKERGCRVVNSSSVRRAGMLVGTVALFSGVIRWPQIWTGLEESRSVVASLVWIPVHLQPLAGCPPHRTLFGEVQRSSAGGKLSRIGDVSSGVKGTADHLVRWSAVIRRHIAQEARARPVHSAKHLGG